MEIIEQHLWPLIVAEYPAVGADDYESVYLTYGPAFGPWRPVAVSDAEKDVTVLASGGLVDDPVTAMVAVAEDWRVLADTPDWDRVPAFPDEPTAGDVARHAPQGLLLRHGLARLAGVVPGIDVPADLPLKVRLRRRG